MRIVCLFVLVVCCSKGIMGSPYIPEAVKIESQRLYDKLKLNEIVGFQAFQQALTGYYKYSDHQKDILVLIDYTKPSTEERFCVVDLEQKKVLYRSHVAHGRRSGDNYAVFFSNKPGSYKSSLGFFRTGTTYYGKNGYSLYLNGLQEGVNDKARERAIVIHGADYADPIVLHSQKRLGRSLGCPALPPDISREVIDTIKNGAILFIYGRDKKTSFV